MTEKKSEIIWTVKDIIQWDKIPLDLVPTMQNCIQKVPEHTFSNLNSPSECNETKEEIKDWGTCHTTYSEEEMNLLRTYLGPRLVLEHMEKEELDVILENLQSTTKMKRKH